MPLLLGLTLLQLIVGFLFCGPLLLLKINPAHWLSYAALLAIYGVLLALGVSYYRNHPRVRSRYTVDERGLGLYEFQEVGSAQPSQNRFLPWPQVAKVELTSNDRIEIHTTLGEIVSSFWGVARAAEYKKVAMRYLAQ